MRRILSRVRTIELDTQEGLILVTFERCRADVSVELREAWARWVRFGLGQNFETGERVEVAPEQASIALADVVGLVVPYVLRVDDESGEPVAFAGLDTPWQKLGEGYRIEVAHDYAETIVWPVVPRLISGANPNDVGKLRAPLVTAAQPPNPSASH